MRTSFENTHDSLYRGCIVICFVIKEDINMFSKILVPLDGSELAESALMPARAVAQNVHGELLLLSVTPPQRIAPEVGGVSVERSFEVVERSRRGARFRDGQVSGSSSNFAYSDNDRGSSLSLSSSGLCCRNGKRVNQKRDSNLSGSAGRHVPFVRR